MSYTKLATTKQATLEEIEAVSGARRNLLLEIYQQGWQVKTRGLLVNTKTGRTANTMTLLEQLTNDSACVHYVNVCAYMVRNGWVVLETGEVVHPEGHSTLPMHEALLACINVGSGN